VADLSVRYAAALFEMSEESGLLSEYLEQAQFLRKSLLEEDALQILTHPRINAGEKLEFVEKAYAGALHQDLFNFIKLTISKNREAFLLTALDRLIEMIRESQNQTTARIVSAVPLSDEQMARLASTLSAKLSKKVDITVLVDPSVIAGISIQVAGYLLDRTVKTMLKDMKETVRRGADE